jgi:hypothetical protein
MNNREAESYPPCFTSKTYGGNGLSRNCGTSLRGTLTARVSAPEIVPVYEPTPAGGENHEMFMCKDLVENIMDYIDNELDMKTLEELEKHTSGCPECRAFVDTYKRMLELTGKLKDRSFVTPEIRERLKALLKSKIKPC